MAPRLRLSWSVATVKVGKFRYLVINITSDGSLVSASSIQQTHVAKERKASLTHGIIFSLLLWDLLPLWHLRFFCGIFSLLLWHLLPTSVVSSLFSSGILSLFAVASLTHGIIFSLLLWDHLLLENIPSSCRIFSLLLRNILPSFVELWHLLLFPVASFTLGIIFSLLLCDLLPSPLGSSTLFLPISSGIFYSFSSLLLWDLLPSSTASSSFS